MPVLRPAWLAAHRQQRETDATRPPSSPSSARPRAASPPSPRRSPSGSRRRSSPPTRAGLRGLPILTRARTPAHGSSGSCRSTEDIRRRVPALAHAAIDEIAAPRAARRSSSAAPACLRAALSDARAAADRPAGERDAGSVSTTAAAPGRRTRSSPARPAAAARVHANDRRRVVRALELWQAGASLAPEQPACGPTTCGTRPSSSASSVARDELDRAHRARAPRQFEHGVEDEVARRGRPSRDAARSLGLGGRSRRCRATRRSRRSSSAPRRASPRYQRKWLRRLPGVVTLDADRPPEEVADEILRWQALGNVYLVAEEAMAPDARAAALRHPLRRRSDGILEVIATTVRLEIVIWNPDGSQAELSGNGTRIAARWLGAHGRGRRR